MFISDYLAVIRNMPTLALLRLFGCRVVMRLGNAPEPGTFYRSLWRFGVNPFVARAITIAGAIGFTPLAYVALWVLMPSE